MTEHRDRDDSRMGVESDPNDTAKLKAILVVVATTAFVISPLVTEPFSGFAPDQLTVYIENPPIQPAGWAFSIWGVIYAWLVLSAGFGLIKRDTDPDWDHVRWPLFGSLAVGAAWIPVALNSPVSATIMIFLMLLGAAWALARSPARDRLWLRLPLGLYAGWLTAASFVALGSVAMGYGLASPLWISFLALAAALALAVWLMLRLRVPTYALAVAWAAVGVTAANASDAPALAGVALGGACGLASLMLKALRPA